MCLEEVKKFYNFISGIEVNIPDGYYVIPDNDKCQNGDIYYSCSLCTWMRIVNFTKFGEKVIICRPKANFKNIVTIE